MTRMATCHPERKHRSKGLCSVCYPASVYAADPDKARANAKRYRDQNPEKSRACVAAWRKAHPGWKRAQNLRANFGITVAEYNALLVKQGGVCAICGETCGTGKMLAVDHCHKSGKIRGLLCFDCNSGIGKLKDDVEMLHRAISYLQAS